MSDDTHQLCQRCEDGEAFSEFTHKAIEGDRTSRYVICKGCLESLGEWFENTEGDR